MEEFRTSQFKAIPLPVSWMEAYQAPSLTVDVVFAKLTPHSDSILLETSSQAPAGGIDLQVRQQLTELANHLEAAVFPCVGHRWTGYMDDGSECSRTIILPPDGSGLENYVHWTTDNGRYGYDLPIVFWTWVRNRNATLAE